MNSRYIEWVKLMAEESRDKIPSGDWASFWFYRRASQRAVRIVELQNIIEDDYRHLQEYRNRKKEEE